MDGMDDLKLQLNRIEKKLDDVLERIEKDSKSHRESEGEAIGNEVIKIIILLAMIIGLFLMAKALL